MLKSELQRRANEFLGSNRLTKVYAVIDGTHMMLDEFEVRYLQAQCTLAPNFEEFTRRVVIYNGPSNKYPIMTWLPNGQFKEKFQRGFYDADGKMQIHILKHNQSIPTHKTFNLY